MHGAIHRLCAYSAGSYGANGFVDEHLTIEWKRMFLICQDCRANFAMPIARTKRRNGAANGQREESDRLTVHVSEACVDVDSPVDAIDIPQLKSSIAPQATTRIRCVKYEIFVSLPRRGLTHRVHG